MINKQREINDLNDKNESVIQAQREKVKQFLFLKQDDYAENRFQIENGLKSIEEVNKNLENQLLIDNRGIKQELKEQEISHVNYLFNLKFSSDRISTKIRSEYERQINEMKTKYDLKISKLRQEMEEYSNKVIRELEEKKEKKIKEITNLNNQKYKEIKNYYNDIISSNLSMIK